MVKIITKKPYRLNKWGTRLLKNNRPLFDWFNDSDDIVEYLNNYHEENMIFRKFLELNDFDVDEIILQGKGLE